MAELLIYEPSFQRLADELATMPGIVPIRVQTDGSMLREDRPVALPDVSIALAWFNSELNAHGPVREFMVQCLKSETMRWLQSGAAGFDHPVFRALVEKGVTLTNSHAAAVPIAEFVMAAVLDHFHPQAARRQRQSERAWKPAPFREVSGTRWLIVGIGHIGSEVAVRARAFGAEVVGVRRNPTGHEPADRVVTLAQLGEELPGADVVVLSAPANADSKHLVDAGFLAALTPATVLVNVGRGSLVDEAALLESLARNIPEHAILDVFEQEPLPADSPLWSHPRVSVSPHSAPNSNGFVKRNDRVFLDNLRRYVKGEPLHGMVDGSAIGG